MPSRPYYRVGRSRTGLGLFATKLIKRRSYICTYRGPVIPNDEAERRENRGIRYLFEINSRWTIDGTSRRNVARYVNHACRPNADAVQRKHKIVYVARYNIQPGQEITVHYGKDYFDSFIGRPHCRCQFCRNKRRKARLAKKRKRARSRR